MAATCVIITRMKSSVKVARHTKDCGKESIRKRYCFVVVSLVGHPGFISKGCATRRLAPCFASLEISRYVNAAKNRSPSSSGTQQPAEATPGSIFR